MKVALTLVMMGAFVATALAQAPIRKLSQTINHPSNNVSAPFISLDGSTLVFTSDYAEDNALTAYFSHRQGASWREPKMLARQLNSGLNFFKGYTLSADGKVLYITSQKSGGVGGFDIWAGSVNSTSWNDFQNMFLPINTKAHEGCPTFTPDGKTIYFMRCEKMEPKRAEGCKIMVSKKAPNGRWEEPVELPSHINTGNSQTPRIAADGETLIFSSNVIQPNRGGMDLYMTKLQNGIWSNPLPLEFVNTEQDDQFVSFTANGRYLLKEAPGKFKTEITEFLFPPHLKPKSVMKVEGLVIKPDGNPASAYLSVVDLVTGNRMFNGRPDEKGSYFFYLVEGSRYELSVDPEDGRDSFFSQKWDMTIPDNPLSQRLDITIKPVQAGDELALNGISFKPGSTVLHESVTEIRRLARLITSATDFVYELQVLLIGYEQDSLQINPDLTEIRIDTVASQFSIVDSLGQTVFYDSLIARTTYHNDRTEKQANTIIDALVTQGVKPESITYFVNAREEPVPENRKLVVRMVVRKRVP